MRTLASPVEAAIEPIRGSRFIGCAAPVGDEAAAREVLRATRARWPEATHHCSAWRLDNGIGRSDDDGEPRGSAGDPILRRIDGAGLSGVAVVVVRWFGGTKLGTGGLVRAYGATAACVLAAGQVVTREVTMPLSLTYTYDLDGLVRGVLSAYGLVPTGARYAEGVTLDLAVPVDRVEGFRREVRERTAGRAIVDAG